MTGGALGVYLAIAMNAETVQARLDFARDDLAKFTNDRDRLAAALARESDPGRRVDLAVDLADAEDEVASATRRLDRAKLAKNLAFNETLDRAEAVEHARAMGRGVAVLRERWG